ncbi:hypothetical protein F5884DRAFT_881636 [Xylogone sp. PMI_703]|nr:hypothetical protein F5884DRAFT_881636 [Xylogone sp. PMI_703]
MGDYADDRRLFLINLESHDSTLAFSRYKQLVQIYVSRTLTYEDDIIKAFEGVLHYLQPSLGPHIWGLPSGKFVEALLWHINKPNGRRANFPSWSWCGWYLSPGSHLTHLECDDPIRSFYNEASSYRPAKFRFIQEMISSFGRSGFPRILSVRARYTTLGIRPSASPYQDVNIFEVVEPTTRRKLAEICLEPERVDLSPCGNTLMTFVELSHRSGLFMNRIQQLQSGRPRTSGFKFRTPDFVIVMAIEKDRDDLWQRVQICEIDRKQWISLLLFDDVFIMK